MLDLTQYDGPLFSDAYRKVIGSVPGISEPSSRYRAAAPPSFRERIVRCIWFDQTLATDRLRTDDGRKLRVLSPGWWNLEAGPDFRNAAIRLGTDAVLKGDVEVHLHANLWKGHGHHTDPNYNRVVLHVAIWRDAAFDTVTAAGSVVPQLTLEPYLTAPLADLADAVDPAEYPEAGEASAGRCQGLLEQGKVTIEWLAHFLDHAGDQRIADKARKLASRFAAADDEQALYEAIAEGLGYKRNKAPALELAHRLPLAVLRERVAQRPDGTPVALAVEALAFGVAGLLPPAGGELVFDDAEREYRDALHRLWRELAGGLADEALDPAQWSFAGTRPPNFPTRRIAALARLAAAHLDRGITRALRDALGPTGQGRLAPRDISRRRAQLLDVFLSVRHPFWDTRCRFGGKPIARAARLIGPDRAHTLIINGVLPGLLYQARRDGDRAFEELLHQLYAAYPKLPSTSITRFMALRLFGRPEKELKTLRSARRQQGLYQLYADFCDSDQTTCKQCPLVRLLEA